MKTLIVRLAVALAVLGAITMGAVGAPNTPGRGLQIYIVGDPRLPEPAAVESVFLETLKEQRRKFTVPPVDMPVRTLHWARNDDVAYARDVLRVDLDELPWVAVAEVDQAGQPVRYLARRGPIIDGRVAALEMFDITYRALASMAGGPTITPPPLAPPHPPIPDGAALPKEVTSPLDGSVMLLVPGGEFYMGSTIVEDERPVAVRSLRAFYMDRTEVTNRQFERFVRATGYLTDAERKGWSILLKQGEPVSTNGISWRNPLGPNTTYRDRMDYPVVHISWNDAEAYCRWSNKRLPTEEEWEKAARGPDGRDYPWGSRQDLGRSNSRYLQRGDVLRLLCEFDNGRGILPVGSLPEGASPFGIHDMLGNVEEWVQDWYHPYPGNARSLGEGEGSEKVKRGGGWNDSQLWASYRNHAWPSECSVQTGFRTCRSPLPTDRL